MAAKRSKLYLRARWLVLSGSTYKY